MVITYCVASIITISRTGDKSIAPKLGKNLLIIFNNGSVRVAWGDVVEEDDDDDDDDEEEDFEMIPDSELDEKENYLVYRDESEHDENSSDGDEQGEEEGASDDDFIYPDESDAGNTDDNDSTKYNDDTLVNNYNAESLFAGGGFQPTSWQSPLPMKTRVRGLGPL